MAVRTRMEEPEAVWPSMVTAPQRRVTEATQSIAPHFVGTNGTVPRSVD
jgi:hypothetical protein